MTEEIKKFYRSRTDRVLFGVCGGLGKYFGYDPILFRLLFVALAFMDGIGIILYILMVAITPEQPGRSKRADGLEGEVDELAGRIEEKVGEVRADIKPEEIRLSESRSLLGALIVLLGLFLLFGEFFPFGWIDMDVVWSLFIIGIGLLIIFKK